MINGSVLILNFLYNEHFLACLVSMMENWGKNNSFFMQRAKMIWGQKHANIPCLLSYGKMYCCCPAEKFMHEQYNNTLLAYYCFFSLGNLSFYRLLIFFEMKLNEITGHLVGFFLVFAIHFFCRLFCLGVSTKDF